MANKKITNTRTDPSVICSVCGEELNNKNSREYATVCYDCQTEHFKRLEERNGSSVALFIACAAFNIPLEPLILPEGFFEKSEEPWKDYIKLLDQSGKAEKNGAYREFFDGVCDLRKVFGKELSQRDLAKYIEMEKRRLKALPGTEEQREMWGTNDLYKGFSMTDEVYDELDRNYSSRLSDFKGQTLSLQQRDALIKVCKWNLTIDYLIRNGNVDVSQKLQKMVQVELESEQMRRKDEKPVEEFRIDALVKALEDNGLMENGDLLTYDELIEVMRDTHIKSKKYDYSLDVADQIILDVLNCMRANADMLTLTELPEDMAVEDAYGEFEPEETEKEKKNKRYAGLTKVSFSKKEET